MLSHPRPSAFPRFPALPLRRAFMCNQHMSNNSSEDWRGGSGEEKKRGGGETGLRLFVLRSVGTSCVSHFLSTIKVNELFQGCWVFFCCCGATFTGKTHCPEAVMRLFAAPQPILIFNQFPQIKNSFHGYTLITEKCLNLSQSVEFILKMCRNFPQM